MPYSYTEDFHKLFLEPSYFTVQQLKTVADTALIQLTMCVEQAVVLRR